MNTKPRPEEQRENLSPREALQKVYKWFGHYLPTVTRSAQFHLNAAQWALREGKNEDHTQHLEKADAILFHLPPDTKEYQSRTLRELIEDPVSVFRHNARVYSKMFPDKKIDFEQIERLLGPTLLLEPLFAHIRPFWQKASSDFLTLQKESAKGPDPAILDKARTVNIEFEDLYKAIVKVNKAFDVLNGVSHSDSTETLQQRFHAKLSELLSNEPSNRTHY